MAAFTWYIPSAADVVIGSGTPADDWLAALNTHITTYSGNASAKWEVADYAASSPKSLLLKRKNGAAGRMIFFGTQGVTPNAAAVRQTSASANGIFCGYSRTSTSNTPDANWNSAAPLSASDYVSSGWVVTNTAATYRLTSAEFDDGFVVLVSNTTTGIGVFGAGELIQKTDGAFLPCTLANGSVGLTNTWATTTSAGSAIIASLVTTNTASNNQAVLTARINNEIHTLYRGNTMAGAANLLILRNSAQSKMTFYPIPIFSNSDNPSLGVIGRMRQMAYGPPVLREFTLTKDLERVGYGHGHLVTTPADSTFWFLDEDI